MKALLIVISILFGQIVFAGKYYISAVGSDDADGTSKATPWQTINKLNRTFYRIRPGDTILLRKGDTFYGTMILSQSGNGDNSIYIGAYGSGANPIISGFTILDTWKPLNDSVQYSKINLNASPQMLTIDGRPVGRGRFPNTGFLTYQTFVRDKCITDSTLLEFPNWTGAEAVIRKSAWTLDRNYIICHKANSLTIQTGSNGGMSNNFGYFIQNAYATLDTMGEWFYDDRKIEMYFGSSGSIPSEHTIKVSSLKTLVRAIGKNHITFDHLDFEGADSIALDLINSSYIIVRNCNFYNIGGTSILSDWGSINNIIEHCVFNNNYKNAIEVQASGPNIIIMNNLIKNIGIIPGTGEFKMNSFANSGDGIVSHGGQQTIEYNIIDSVGHSGIRFDSGGVSIRNNFIDHFALVRNDAGGIYAVGLNPTDGSVIKNNIVLNGVGNPGGMDGNFLAISGIYLDDRCTGIQVSNNSVANIINNGIFIQSSHDIQIHGNTIYECGYSSIYIREKAVLPNSLIRNINLINNLYIVKSSNEKAMIISTDHSKSVPNFGNSDSNIYALPKGNNSVFSVVIAGSEFHGIDLSLYRWISSIKKDIHSRRLFITNTDSSDLQFIYNSTTSDTIIAVNTASRPLSAGSNDKGNMKLKPYTSIVLINLKSTRKTRPRFRKVKKIFGL